jgi:hypothetical protein
MAPTDAIGPDASQLRERLPQNPSKSHQTASAEAAKQTVAELNAAEAKRQDGQEKRTYGRTPDGTGTLEYLLSNQATYSSIDSQCHAEPFFKTSETSSMLTDCS